MIGVAGLQLAHPNILTYYLDGNGMPRADMLDIFISLSAISFALSVKFFE